MAQSERRITILTIIAVFLGLLTLAGLLFFPTVGDVLLSWGSLLAAFALLLGILNLLRVHVARTVRERSVFSLTLVLSMLGVFGLAITDWLNITSGGVLGVFRLIQSPLETAVASLLAFVLLFAGFRLLRNRRNIWSILFMLTAVFILVSAIPALGAPVNQLRTFLEATVITAGMRGILIGVALGSIIISMRLLLGLDQPYNK